MNSIELLLQSKLRDALFEQRKRIAASLLELAEPAAARLQGQTMSNNEPRQPEQQVKKTEAVNTGERRQKKAEQISKLNQQVTNLQSKAATAKDPEAMRSRLDILRTKLALAQKEMQAID